MKVFISWSGSLSRQIAAALRDWLPMAIQAVKPYMSERDNEAGVRWEGKVSTELATSNFGILCLTPDNLTSAWLRNLAKIAKFSRRYFNCSEGDFRRLYLPLHQRGGPSR